MPTTYPYWDTDNRYIVAGPAGRKATVFAEIYQLPSTWWQVRCCGSRSACPEKLGPYFGPIATAQDAIESHCQAVHYIVPPPGSAALAAAAAAGTPADPTTPSKIIPRF